MAFEFKSIPRKAPRKPRKRSRADTEFIRAVEFRQKPFGKKGRRDFYTLKQDGSINNQGGVMATLREETDAAYRRAKKTGKVTVSTFKKDKQRKKKKR